MKTSGTMIVGKIKPIEGKLVTVDSHNFDILTSSYENIVHPFTFAKKEKQKKIMIHSYGTSPKCQIFYDNEDHSAKHLDDINTLFNLCANKQETYTTFIKDFYKEIIHDHNQLQLSVTTNYKDNINILLDFILTGMKKGLVNNKKNSYIFYKTLARKVTEDSKRKNNFPLINLHNIVKQYEKVSNIKFNNKLFIYCHNKTQIEKESHFLPELDTKSSYQKYCSQLKQKHQEKRLQSIQQNEKLLTPIKIVNNYIPLPMNNFFQIIYNNKPFLQRNFTSQKNITNLQANGNSYKNQIIKIETINKNR